MVLSCLPAGAVVVAVIRIRAVGNADNGVFLGNLVWAEWGLCTFVCPSKIEIASIIRRGLDGIVKEG